MKKKLIAKLLATVLIVGGLTPQAAFADITQLITENDSSISQSDIKISKSTVDSRFNVLAEGGGYSGDEYVGVKYGCLLNDSTLTSRNEGTNSDPEYHFYASPYTDVPFNVQFSQELPIKLLPNSSFTVEVKFYCNDSYVASDNISVDAQIMNSLWNSVSDSKNCGVIVTNNKLQCKLSPAGGVYKLQAKYFVNGSEIYQSKELHLNLVNKTQLIEDSKNNIKASFTDFTATNNTTEADVLSYAKACNDQSKVTTTISNFKKTPATDKWAGKITGTLTVQDENNSATFDFNLPIAQLPQTVNTVYTNFEAYLRNFKATNNTEANDIINAVSVSNPAVKVTMSGFKKDKASDSLEGLIIGNLNITDNVTTKILPVNLKIDKLAQSATTAKNNISACLTNMRVTNDTKEIDVLNAIKVSVDTSSVTLKFGTGEGEQFYINKATEKAKGYITGNIIITDKTGVNTNVPVNLTIAQLPQSLNTIKTLYEQRVQKFVGTNESKDKDILDSVYITNENINVQIENFKVKEATDTVEGLITGNVVIKDTLENKTEIVPINVKIGYLPQELSTAVRMVQKVVNTRIIYNNTSINDVLVTANDVISNPNIKAYYDLDTGRQPIKTLATEVSDGSIFGVILVTDKTNTIEVPVNLTIPRLPQTVEGLKNLLKINMGNLTVDNNTEEADILYQLNNFVTTTNGNRIDLEFSKEDPFKKLKADQTKDGSITGTVVIKDTAGNSTTLPLNLKISKLTQTVDGIKSQIEAMLPNMKVTNDTEAADIINSFKPLITGAIGSKIEIAFGAKLDEEFNKLRADQTKEGSITGVVLITDGYSIAKVPINFKIDKLVQTAEDVKNNWDNILDGIIVDNNTTDQDILDKINQNINNPNITVEFSKDKPFKKEESTGNSTGSITGTIIIKDKDGNTAEADINFLISKIPSAGGGGGSSTSKHKNSELDENILEIKETTTDKNIPVNTTELTEEQKSQEEENKVEKINNVLTVNNENKEENIKVKDYVWNAENLNKGVVSKIIKNGEEVGTYLKAENALAPTLEVKISTDKDITSEKVEKNKIYSKNEDLNKYILSKTVDNKDGNINFVATNKKEYLITKEGQADIQKNLIANQGWNTNQNGEWKYVDGENIVKNSWKEDSPSNWFKLNNDGSMETGWINNNGNWYYLNPVSDGTKGVMKTGWINNNGNWYYLNSTSDGTKGAMKTGWIKDNGDWYYCDPSGAMVTNTTIDGYTLDSSGKLV